MPPARAADVSRDFVRLLRKYGASPRLLRTLDQVSTKEGRWPSGAPDSVGRFVSPVEATESPVPDDSSPVPVRRSIRVLVADDEEDLREVVERMLSRRGITMVGKVGDGVAAVEATEALLPDVVLMDIGMPKMDGISATREIKRRFPACKVLMETGLATADQFFESLAAGASGYVTKPFTGDALVSAIEGVMNGEYPFSPKVAGLLINEFSVEVEWPDGPISPRLTEAEGRILELLAANIDHSSIGQLLDVPESTVLRQIDNVIQKLQIHTIIQDGIRSGRQQLIFVDSPHHQETAQSFTPPS
jgi:DNA-binding NarL/FixJ family response regulator